MCLSNSAKMVFYSRDQDNSNGSILKNPIIDPRNVDKEGEKVSRNSSVPPVQEFQGSNPERPIAFVTVDESSEPGVFRERKEQSERLTSIREVVKNGSNPPHRTSSCASMFSTNVGRHVMAPIHHAAPVSASKPASAIPSVPASTELKCRGDKNIAVKDVNGGQSLCSTDDVGIVSQPIVVIKKKKFYFYKKKNFFRKKRKRKKEKVSQPTVSTSRNLEEIKETTGLKDVSGLNLDQSRHGLCSTVLRKVAQPSVSTSWNLEEIKETSSGLTYGLVKTSSSNEAYYQLDLHERLNSIYDSVLIVDNLTIAKEVVRMLTNKYRHLVHACGTEVLF